MDYYRLKDMIDGKYDESNRSGGKNKGGDSKDDSNKENEDDENDATTGV